MSGKKHFDRRSITQWPTEWRPDLLPAWVATGSKHYKTKPHRRIARFQTKLMYGRSPSGSQIAEFVPALVILVCFVAIPLLDYTIVPIRWMLAQEIVSDYSRKLAFCETFSESFGKLQKEPSLITKLHNLGGIDIKGVNLHLRISRVAPQQRTGEFLMVDMPQRIPAEWLPNGGKAPCSYLLELQVDSRLSPAIMLPGSGGGLLPGVTAPVPLTISGAHEWENLGRDPVNGQFYVNE